MLCAPFTLNAYRISSAYAVVEKLTHFSLTLTICRLACLFLFLVALCTSTIYAKQGKDCFNSMDALS